MPRFPKFCKSSLLWTWSKFHAAFLGALYLRLLRVWIRKRKLKYSLPIFFFLFGLFGFGSYLLIHSDWGSELNLAIWGDRPLASAIIYLATLGLPMGWWMGWKTRVSVINRWLQFDSFLASLSLAVIIWAGFQSFDLWSLEPYILIVAANHWVFQFLRIIEAAGAKQKTTIEDQKQLKLELPFPMTQDLHREIESSERLTVLLGSLVFITALIAFSSFFDLSYLSKIALLGLAPLALPFRQVLSSKILRRSLAHRVYLPKLHHFEKISKIRHLRSHHLGVFTEANLKFEDWWLDPSSAWTEKEIEELVASLTRDVSHPICEALHARFRESDLHVRLADMESLPHLGLRVSFRNSEGQMLNICLGSLNWFLAELHDLSPEGQREFQSWFDQSKLACFLSINRRVVAGFSFSSQKRLGEVEFFETLRAQKRPICLLSSSNPTAIQISRQQFEEVSLNLLPLEREVQLNHWAERAPSFIELRSTWDQPPSDQAYPIIFGRKPDKVSFENYVCILHESLSSFSWLLNEAESWKGRKQRAYAIPFSLAGLGLGLCFIPALLPRPWLSRLLYFFWDRRQA